MAASLLSKAVLTAMEKKLMSNYQWRTEIGRTSYAEGREEGKAEAARHVLLEILEGRGLKLSEQARARIAQGGDPEVLQAWAVKAALVRAVDEIFG